MSRVVRFAAVVAFGSLIASAHAQTYTETILHTFTGKADGYEPTAALVADNSGNLYGTAAGGKNSGDAVIFKLATPPQGQTIRTETVIATFPKSGIGGYNLNALALDSAGNLYGSAESGGSAGHGTVFELNPPKPGHTAWTGSVLYSFTGGSDGAAPVGRVVLDAAGNLYGTTIFSGPAKCANTNGCGTAWKLTRPAAGKSKWIETTIYAFGKAYVYGPAGGLIFDKIGNLYGTVQQGGVLMDGSGGNGEVFMLSPVAGQTTWIKSALWTFDGNDGDYPSGELTFDAAGNLYGATASGGTPTVGNPSLCAAGTLFQLQPTVSGSWSHVAIASLDQCFGFSNGLTPNGGLVLDKEGAVYGTTEGGGGMSNGGTVFKITPISQGSWAFSTLYAFAGCNGCTSADGGNPSDGVIFDAAGNLYGTTSFGGTPGLGTTFELTPSPVSDPR